MRPLLTVGFSTLTARAANVAVPRFGDDTEVLICVQGGSIAEPPARTRVVEVGGLGVARSRNAAIEHAQGNYLLFCDDDVIVDPRGVSAAVEYLRRTGQAVAMGRASDPTGSLRKPYPKAYTRLTRFNTAKAATYELLIDVDQVRAAGVWFDERFGAGAPLHLADEYIFIVDLLRAGLRGVTVPDVFGAHAGISSGLRWGADEDRHARAVALNRVFGAAAPVARTVFAVKHRHNLGTTRNVLDFIADNTPPPALEH